MGDNMQDLLGGFDFNKLLEQQQQLQLGGPAAPPMYQAIQSMPQMAIPPAPGGGDGGMQDMMAMAKLAMQFFV